MNTLHIKTGDTVIVLSGKDKGKQGKVLSCDPTKGAVIVEGINFATKHTKARRQGETGGIIKQEIPLRACKVMRVCPKCDKPTRVKHELLASGEKVRICSKCKENI